MVQLSDSYHHGNVPAALKSAALVRIETDGIENLSFRALARDIGVSQAAPYRHYKDKKDLLAELASSGFILLAQCQKDATLDNRGLDVIIDMGLAYLQFAQNNPIYYRLMFGMYSQDYFRHEKLQDSSDAMFESFVTQLAEATNLGLLIDKDPKTLARIFMASLHGAAAIITNDIYKDTPFKFNVCFTDFVRSTVQGITK